jgi:asparagine synthase (glutamine-hydrolysing)
VSSAADAVERAAGRSPRKERRRWEPLHDQSGLVPWLVQNHCVLSRFLGVAGAALERRPFPMSASYWEKAGAFAVAWGPGASPPGRDQDVFCLLDGRIDTLVRLGEQLGADPARPPEQLLARGYRRYGSAVLNLLRGNFALVIWRADGRDVLLAVDQLASRSLVFCRRAGDLVFAAELRDLLPLLPRQPQPRAAAIVAWLSGAHFERHWTLYDDVERLPGGTFLRLEEGQWSKHRYWQPTYRPAAAREGGAIVAEVTRAIDRAVARRLPLDEPTGILLSGGLDSATVAASAVASVGSERVRLYSALFPRHPSVDEGPLVAKLEAQLGVATARVSVRGGGTLKAALEFMREWKVPSRSPNLFFLQALSVRAALDGVGVLLDGEGGDELFGLQPYLLADRLRAGRLRSLADLARRVPGYRSASRRERAELLRTYALTGALPWTTHELARLVRRKNAYTPDWLQPTSAEHASAVDIWSWKRVRGPRWWAAKADQLTAGRERGEVVDFLRRKAAAVGLADGHPFLADLDLIELLLSLPPEESFDAVLDRPLLRASNKGRLPDGVRLRPEKSYFDPVFRESLGGADWEVVTRLLGDPRSEIMAYVRPEIVRERILGLAPEQRNSGWAWTVWRLASAECWLRFQADPAFADRALADWPLAPADIVFEAFG